MLVLFFKTSPPVDPTEFVLSFCQNAASHPERKQAFAVRRITPVTLIAKATEKGLDELAETVLRPHFHGEGVKPKKVGCPLLPLP